MIYYVFEHADIFAHEPHILFQSEDKEKCMAFAFVRCSQVVNAGFKFTGCWPEIPSFHFDNDKLCISIAAGFATNIKLL